MSDFHTFTGRAGTSATHPASGGPHSRAKVVREHRDVSPYIKGLHYYAGKCKTVGDGDRDHEVGTKWSMFERDDGVIPKEKDILFVTKVTQNFGTQADGFFIFLNKRPLAYFSIFNSTLLRFYHCAKPQ